MLNFKNENLDKADFTGIDAPDSLFDTCSMEGCSFEGNFEGSEFLNCQMSTSEFTYASLAQIKFLNVFALSGLSFDTSDLTGAQFQSCDADMTFFNCDMQRTQFKGVQGSIFLKEGSELVEGSITQPSKAGVIIEDSRLVDTNVKDNTSLSLLVNSKSKVENLLVEGGAIGVSLNGQSVVEEMTLKKTSRIDFNKGAGVSLSDLRIEENESSYFSLIGVTDVLFISGSRKCDLYLRKNSVVDTLGLKSSNAYLQVLSSSILGFDSHLSSIWGEIKESFVRDAVFTETSLSDLDVGGSKIEESLFKGVDFMGSSFNRSSFKRTSFARVISSRGYFTSSSFEEGAFTSCNLTSAHLDRAVFKGVVFRNTTFDMSFLPEAQFSECTFLNTQFKECDLKGASFILCKFDDPDKTFEGSDTSTTKFI